MIEPKLTVKVVKRGTHLVKMEDINSDRPSPCECVAEQLADVEYRIAELVRLGGYNPNKIGPMSLNAHALDSLRMSVNLLNSVLNEATKQNWKLELERNPDVVTHMAMDPDLPREGCNCDICAEVRQYGPVNSESWCAHRRELLKAGQI